MQYQKFRGLRARVRSLYQYSKPLHHLPSARKIELDPQGSSIFVVNYRDFMAMKPHDIQSVFRRRHILVLGTPTEDMKFDLDGLSTVSFIE
jgi:hypothetical protein